MIDRDDFRVGFEERHRDAALARGAEPEAVAAAFKLAATVECVGNQDLRAVTDALNAYWRSVGVEP